MKILSVFAFKTPFFTHTISPYAFWITRMARMDKRLLETLRGVRTGEIQFKQVNPPHVHNLLTGLCEDLGLNPQMGMFSNVPSLDFRLCSRLRKKKCPVVDRRHAGRLIYLAILAPSCFSIYLFIFLASSLSCACSNQLFANQLRLAFFFLLHGMDGFSYF
jgi:hypothetical protein